MDAVSRHPGILPDDPIVPLLDAWAERDARMEALVREFESKLDGARGLTPEGEADLIQRIDRRVNARLSSLPRAHLLRTGLLGASVLVGGMALAGAGCYAWGRSVEAARSREVGGALAASLRDGSASGQRWLDLMHGNDILAALQRCDARNTGADAAGRRACAVPLWIDPPNTSGPPAVPTGGK